MPRSRDCAAWPIVLDQLRQLHEKRDEVPASEGRIIESSLIPKVDHFIFMWVRSTTGTYRPFKSDKFLSESYAEMVTRGVLTDRLRRLLSGVVRVGDSPDEVKWSLGIPTQEEESTAEELQITIWHYPGVQVRFENQVVKQIK